MNRGHSWRWIVGRLLLCYAVWIYAPMLIAYVIYPSAFGLTVYSAEIHTVARNPSLFLLAASLSSVFVTATTLALARRVDRRSWSELGLTHIRQLGRVLGFGLCLGALVPAVNLLILLVTEQHAIQSVNIPTIDWWQYSLMAIAVISNAWNQELVFRGYTLANLGDRLRPKLMIPACGFAFILPYFLGGNFTWAGMLSQGLTGMLLALAFLYQRNLWLPLWIHTSSDIVHNLLVDKTFSVLVATQQAGAVAVDLANAASVVSAMVLMTFLAVRERLSKKVSQINHISEIREQLKKSTSIEKSLEIILDGAMKDLDMAVAAVLVLRKQDQTAEVRSLKSNIKTNLGKAYSLDKPYAEFECLNKKQSCSKITRDELSILGTKSVHSAPVTFRGETYGILAMGNMREQVLDESDLSVLSLYSGLVTTAFETASLSVEPIREYLETREAKYKIESGSSYILEDDTDKAYDVFKDSIMSGMEGLCITRILPDKIRERYELKKTPIVWLTDEIAEGQPTVSNLQDLSVMISNFVEKAERPLILIDGVEYLASRYGFNSVYLFLQTKRSQIEKTGSALIITLFKGALDPKEVRLLEREFQLLKYNPAKGEVSSKSN